MDVALRVDELLTIDCADLDPDEMRCRLVALGELRARVDAATAALVAAFDRSGEWAVDGARSLRSWLVHHTKQAGPVAGAQVWLARRLRQLPAMSAALAAGMVTEGHARLLARCVGPRTSEALCRDEQVLVDTAATLSADDFGVVVARWLALNDPEGTDPAIAASEAHCSKYFDGRLKGDMDLDVDDGAIFGVELDARYEDLWRRDRDADDDDPLKGRSHAQRLAAALVEMARRSSAVDDNEHPDGRSPRAPEFVVIVNSDGTGELDDGTVVPVSTLERWMCDASYRRVVLDAKSIPIDVSEATYEPNRAQRRALRARDRGCVVPGCGMKARWCHAHHVTRFAQGKTTLDNLVLLCDRHHKQVHNGIICLEPAGPQRWTVLKRDGTPVLVRPPPELAA